MPARKAHDNPVDVHSLQVVLGVSVDVHIPASDWRECMNEVRDGWVDETISESKKKPIHHSKHMRRLIGV